MKKSKNNNKNVYLQTILDYVDEKRGLDYVQMDAYGENAIDMINIEKSLPYILKDGRIHWKISMSEVTLIDFYQTFSSYRDKNKKIFQKISEIGHSSKDPKVVLDRFAKYYKGSYNEWKIGKKKCKIKALYRYVISSGVSVEYVLDAIWIRDSYNIQEFCYLFNINKHHASLLLEVAGYREMSQGNYSIVPHSKEAIQNCVDKANSSVGLGKGICSFRKKLCCSVYRRIRTTANSVSKEFGERLYELGDYSEWNEPAFGKRKDLSKRIFAFVIVIVMLLIIFFLIYLFYTNMLVYKSALSDGIVGFWGSVAGALLAGLMTILTTYWIIEQGYIKDYHNERMSVLPVFKMSILERNAEFKNEDGMIYRIRKKYGKGEVWWSEPPYRNLMVVCFENIGSGAAFSVELSGVFAAEYNNPEIQSIMCDEKHYVFIPEHGDTDSECKIFFYDLYGNYYFQKFRFGNRYGNTDKLAVYTLPPELVTRTSRVRYRQ